MKTTYKAYFSTQEDCNCTYSHDTSVDTNHFDSFEDAKHDALSLVECHDTLAHSTVNIACQVEKYIDDELDDDYEPVMIFEQTWNYKSRQWNATVIS